MNQRSRILVAGHRGLVGSAIQRHPRADDHEQLITVDRDTVDFRKEVVGFTCATRFEAGKPDGPPRKLLDVSRLDALGWKPQFELREGIQRTYRWFLDNQDRARGA